MKHYIPENIIEEIRSRTDIVEIVSESVALKKNGLNFKGLCPFHSEKTASFTVSPEKRIYHCFGCGAGGNAFKFLMETQNLSFVEAVKSLASKTHITLPSQVKNKTQEKKERERETLLELNRLASEYFTAALNHPQKGKRAGEYLKSRRMGEDIISRYQLGWAAPNWQDMKMALEKTRPSALGDMVKAGLIIRKDGGSDKKHFDRFRGRIMIPLKDLYGNLIGFAGRTIDKGEPKYLNSPETPLYIKGKHLYGMNFAKESIRGKNQAILVEGYFDQIRASQQGIHNVVATCGTALTQDQANLLKNQTRNVVLVFDSDAAGQLAAQRGFEVLLEKDIKVKIVHLPTGHDPDSYISEFGPEAFLQEIQTSKPFFESYIDAIIDAGSLKTPLGRVDVVDKILPLLKKIKTDLERNEWVKYIWERVGVDEGALRKELQKALTQNQPHLKVPETNARNNSAPELYLIHLMLSDSNAAKEIRGKIDVQGFNDPDLKQVGEMIYQFLDAGRPIQIDRLLDQTEIPEIRALLSRIGLEPIVFDDISQGTADCINELKKENLENKIKDLKQMRNKAEKAGDSERSREIHGQLKKIQLSLIPG